VTIQLQGLLIWVLQAGLASEEQTKVRFAALDADDSGDELGAICDQNLDSPTWQCVKTNSTPVVHIKIAGKWMFIPL